MADEENPIGQVRRVGRKDRKKELPKPTSLFPLEDEVAETETRPTQDVAEDTQESVPEFPTEPLSLDLGDEFAKLAGDVFAEDTQQTASPSATMPDPHARFRPPIEPIPPVAPSQPQSVDTSERYPPASFETTVAPSVKPASKPVALPPDNAPAPKRERRYGKWYHDLIALGFMLGTVGLGVLFVTIWRDPWTPLNPLAPATPFVIVSWTPDMVALATYYAEQTQFAQQPAPQNPTPDAPPITAQDVAQPINPPSGDKPFTISEAGVIYTPNANGRGCNWSSIAGTVTALSGEPIDGYAIQIVDIEDPTRLNVVVTSGSSLSFGAGGFELSLGGTPRIRGYRIQLYDSANVALSEAYQIFTREACDENVAVVNFVQVR